VNFLSDLEKEVQFTICSFCGKKQETTLQEESDQGVEIFFNGLKEQVNICTTCARRCVDIATQHMEELMPEECAGVEHRDVRPSSIRAFLDEYVIQQDYAKEVLAVAIYNHYKLLGYKERECPDVELDKSNIILVGPTGCGKTFLVKTIARMLDVPFAMADSSSLTAAGYVGEDVENAVRLLLQNADWDIERAQRGIIYFDEVDKIGRKSENPSITRDVGGEGVQQALLKIVEGSVVEVSPKGQRKHPNGETMKVDTSNILFIAGGSFEGIEDLIKKRMAKKDGASAFGFGSKLVNNKESYNEIILNAEADDLRQFGMIPEFVGRFPVICPLQELTEEALCSILTEPKNALVKQYQELLKIDNIQLEFEPEAIKAIAQKAITRKTGARGLRGIMEDILQKPMYSLPDESTLRRLIITKECVTEGMPPIVEDLEKAG
jgi:ATP-dependent Clp protease ATP-binding subunit ClpX